MHDENAAIEPRAAYATSKRYGEERLLELAGDGLVPAILRNGTVYGWSPRMRFDLVVNTFVKDALLEGRLSLHGGGWMWRPLVDVRDAADAMIAAYEAPAELVRGEIFNVLHSNYQIRELAMIVAGSVGLARHPVKLEEVPAPTLTRDYECSNAKLSMRLGFIPRHSVLDAVNDMLARIGAADRTVLTDPRHYNIRWLELMSELQAAVRALRHRPVVPRTLITGGGGQLASDLATRVDGAVALSHAELDIADADALDARVRRAHAGARAQLRRVPQRRRLRARARLGVGGQRARGARARAALRPARREAGALLDQLRLRRTPRRAVRRGRPSEPAVDLRPDEAGRRARGAGLRPAARSSCGPPGLYGLAGSASKGGNFVQRMIARAQSRDALRMVADQRLQPTFTADLADAVLAAVERDVEGVVHLVADGACSWHEFTLAIMDGAGLDVPSSRSRRRSGPARSIVPSTVCWPAPRGWRRCGAGSAQLADYMDRAGLAS